MALVLSGLEWLESTTWSVTLHESVWAYPVIESVHVLSLCLFVGFTLMMDLRLVGLAFRRAPILKVVEQLAPWIRGGFVLMLVSGALLFYTTPVKFYENVFFQAKVVMLVLAGTNAWLFHRRARRLTQTERATGTVPGARLAGGISLLLWTGVITSGRMVAYNWFK
jgi:hypothetical protein